MKFKQVEYREARLLSTAQFENARIEIGVVVEVESQDELADAMHHAKEWVRNELVERIMDMQSKGKAAEQEDRRFTVRRKYGL